MKMYGRVKHYIEMSGQRHAPGSLKQRAPGTQWKGGRVGSRAGLDMEVKTNPCTYRVPNLGCSAYSQVTILTELSQLLMESNDKD
jgi:hypothetical protein